MSENTLDPFGGDLSHGHHDPLWAADHHHTFSDADQHYFSTAEMAASTLGADVIHGDPTEAVSYWFHQTGEDCVPSSAAQVISEATGHPISEQEILQRMSEIGLGQPGPNGAPFADVPQLLLSYGIPSHIENTTLQQLESYLDQGRSVIVGVNAHPIWREGDPLGPANHAVMITAIDTTAGTVTLSDTGTPDGNVETVPLNVFEQAWADSHNSLCVTDVDVADHPGPALMPLTVNPHSDVTSTPATPTAPATPVPAHEYTVKPGDTLWDIAERAYGNGADYKVIAQANGIANPNLILPGQVLTIPAEPR